MPNHAYTRRLAAIAYAPIPEEGHAYLYREGAPFSARSQVSKSPYAPYIKSYDYVNREADTIDIYVTPTQTPPFHYSNVPTTHQPDPDADPPVPVELPEKSNTEEWLEYSAISKEQRWPTGRWFIISPNAHKNLHYYRSKYPQAEIVQRASKAYARFFPKKDAHPDIHPYIDYADPPPLHRSDDHTRDTPETPDTAYIYLRPYVSHTKTPPPYEVRNDVLNQNRYYVITSVADLYTAAETGPTAEPSDLYRFICQQAHTIYYHPEGPDPDEFPAFLHNYTPLRQIRAGQEG